MRLDLSPEIVILLAELPDPAFVLLDLVPPRIQLAAVVDERLGLGHELELLLEQLLSDMPLEIAVDERLGETLVEEHMVPRLFAIHAVHGEGFGKDISLSTVSAHTVPTKTTRDFRAIAPITRLGAAGARISFCHHTDNGFN